MARRDERLRQDGVVRDASFQQALLDIWNGKC